MKRSPSDKAVLGSREMNVAFLSPGVSGRWRSRHQKKKGGGSEERRGAPSRHIINVGFKGMLRLQVISYPAGVVYAIINGGEFTVEGVGGMSQNRDFHSN